MSFIGSGIYGMLRKAGLSFAVAGLCGGGILIFYTLMIGGSVSAVRALLMFLIRAGADVAGRDYDLPTSLAAAAAVTGAWQPLYLMDAAYQLSYGAILGIALLTPLFEDMMAGQKAARPDSADCHPKRPPVPYYPASVSHIIRPAINHYSTVLLT